MKTGCFLLAGCLISLPMFVGCNGGSDSNSTPPSTNATVACPAVMAASQAVSSLTVHSHIPRVVQNYSDQGPISQDHQLSVTIALSLNNPEDLKQRLHDLYDPESPSYHQFMKPSEFRARYAPTADQLADVTSFLESRGLRGFALDPDGYMLRASGSVGVMNSAFSTEIHQYADAVGGQYFAPATEPQFPVDLAISAVHGLQNITHFRKHLRAFETPSGATPQGSGPDGGLTPSDIRTAYSLPTTVTGSGQTLGLFELDGYTASDITTYESLFGIAPSVSLQNILIDGASGVAGSDADEVTLDIELMAAAAPGATKIIVYEGPNAGQAILDVYAKIADDNQATAISTSWGSPEDATSAAFTTSENVIFEQMAAQGQSIFAAAGDSGAYDDGRTLSVDDPGSQPYMVSVGGTHLNYSNSYISETSWNDGFGDAGGGGYSSVWPAPNWQSGALGSESRGCPTMRNVPDVSLDADPNTGYSIYYHGGWTILGGTSCAAPLWAGFAALVNEQRATNHLSALGFPNPAIYTIGEGASYLSDFHDIAGGSTNLYYPAVPGFDDSTGWGSFIGTGLFDSLSTE